MNTTLYLKLFKDEWHILLLVLTLQIFIELIKREFVSFLKFSIILIFILNGIIGQVNSHLIKISHVKYSRGCPDISMFVPICWKFYIKDTFFAIIYQCYENEASNIEFSPLIKERISYVFLHDKADLLLFHKIKYILQILHYYLDYNLVFTFNALAPIRILSWFNYPHISRHNFLFKLLSLLWE